MKTLLVIDDNQEDRDLVKLAIGACYTIAEASDGYSGMLLAHKGQYDVILLDLVLQPPIVPAEFVDQLHKASPRTAIVVFSGSSNPMQIGEAFVAGVDGLGTEADRHDKHRLPARFSGCGHITPHFDDQIRLALME